MSIDRTKVFTGPLNLEALPEPPLAGRTLNLYDTTLRDGEQTTGVVLAPETKLEIARALDDVGVDRIEAGFPRVSDADGEAIEAIAGAGLRAEVWGFSRAVAADLELLVDLGVAGVTIEAPISDGKLAAYGLDRERILGRITDATRLAAAAGLAVAFFGVDGSRTDLGFLQRVYTEAIEAGATEAVMVDTVGVCTPEVATLMVQRAASWLGPEVPIHWHGHDDYGLATALSLAAVRAGADWVQGTINGMGERAGNADLVEVALAASALYGADTRLDLSKVREVSRLVRERAGYALEPWKAIVGENLFDRESGAVASQFHDPPAIEPYAAELVGARRRIVLGKKSGIDSVRIKLGELGLDAPEDRQREILVRVKDLGLLKRGPVTDDEFRALVGEVAGP